MRKLEASYDRKVQEQQKHYTWCRDDVGKEKRKGWLVGLVLLLVRSQFAEIRGRSLLGLRRDH